MFSFLRRKKEIFKPEEKKLILDAVREAERATSGEVRVYVERRCSYVDALDRAVEVFWNLEMFRTEQRNAVLIYVAVKDHQLAVFGDEGIHRKVGKEYWDDEVMKMIHVFNRENYAVGIAECVKDIGEALQNHFPYTSTDKNELSDDIEFGR